MKETQSGGERGFIVKLEPSVWLAPWDGDPGRTLVRSAAKVFHSEADATTALSAARTYRPFQYAVVQPRAALEEQP